MLGDGLAVAVAAGVGEFCGTPHPERRTAAEQSKTSDLIRNVTTPSLLITMG